MNPMEKDLGTTTRLGVMLFDEQRSRVFAVRGNLIEDAREFAVDMQHVASDMGPLRSRHRASRVLQRRQRVVDTVTLLTDLHHRYPLDRLILVAPGWARTLMRRYLPSTLAEKVFCVVDIPADAGESTILAMTLRSALRLKATARTAA